ncbi:hypothetical protein QJS10_CPA02g01266 [Acorus calamus]|uniref:Uncharacterized protein n=1 Tax=Acorus calamus TaxID=4465 RepID=A0AAV9FEJ3_ACOCL|nr:hypothetical protein QJS10_CPA02g01266 [Acorus calamus]
MAYADKTLEEQLVEVGGRLASPPSNTEELLSLLDHTESILSRVQQSPSESMTKALDPSLKALVANELLRHSDTDVKIFVACCISEITRITAPEAPYEDDLMKEIFQMIVEAFENLSDMSGRSYAKLVSILETVAKVRSCVVMLDLECDGLILDMFRHFFKTIRDSHPDSVLSSMETIMTLVLEESEEISPELLTSLLDSVKKENKAVLPIVRKLGEKVITSCAAKLKPLLKEAVQSTGASFNDYLKIVATVCNEACSNPDPNDKNSSGENLADDSKLSDRTVSDELPQVVGNTESGSLEVVSPTDKSSKSVMSNGTAQIDKCSSRVSNSPNNSDHSRTESERENMENPDKKAAEINEVNSSTSDGLSVKQSVEQLDNEDKAGVQQSPGEDDRDALPPQEPDVVCPSRDKPSSKGSTKEGSEKSRKQKGKSLKNATENEAALSSGLKKKIGGTNKSGAKSSKITTKEEKHGQEADIGETAPLTDISPKKDIEATSDSEDKLLKHTVKKGHTGTSSEGESRGKREKDKTQTQKGKDIFQDDEAEQVSLKKMVSSSKSTTKASNKEQSRSDGNKSKKKRVKGSEKASEEPGKDKGLDKDIVGSRIKVWWPDDAMFYNGVIESFDPATKKHKVHYDDGDEEILLLKDERWEFINDDTAMDVVESADPQTPEVTPEMERKRKAKSESGSVSKKAKKSVPHSETNVGIKLKEDEDSTRKSDDAMKPRGRPRGSSSSKVRASAPKTVGKSVGGSSETENKSKDSTGKMKDKTPKTELAKSKVKFDGDSKSKDDQPKPSSKAQGDGSKSGRKAKGTSATPKSVSKASANGDPAKGTPELTKAGNGENSSKAESSKVKEQESEGRSETKRRRKA